MANYKILKSKRPFWKKILPYFPAIVVFIGLPLMFIVIFALDSCEKRRAKIVADIFEPILSEYTELEQLNLHSVNNSPYIIGKVVLIDLYPGTEHSSKPNKLSLRPGFLPAKLHMEWTKQINHHEFFRLPKELRAVNPEEVGTIICLAWDTEEAGTYRIGQYSTGTSSYIIKCHMTIFDREKAIIVDEHEFHGGPPPKKKRYNNKPGFGSKPTRRIVEYIESLMRYFSASVR